MAGPPMTSHRWSKFWWQDWQREPSLRMCSLAARGLWMEILCIAHEGTPYGHATVNGKPPTTKQIACIAGITETDAARLLRELEDAGVFSRGDDNSIFCRRMVREKQKSDDGRVHADKRWGNGHPNGAPNGSGNGHPNTQDFKNLEREERGIEGKQCACTREARAVAQVAIKALKAKPPPYTPSREAQLSAFTIVRERRQPVDPVRTPDEQLAALGIGQPK